MHSELEILTGIVRTRSDDGTMISARTITGHLTTATFVGLVAQGRFRISREERESIAECLRRHGFTEWDLEREENGVVVRHKPIAL